MVTKLKKAKITKSKGVKPRTKRSRSTKGALFGLSFQNPVTIHKPIVRGTPEQREMKNLNKQMGAEQKLSFKTSKLKSQADYYRELARKRAYQKSARRGSSISLLKGWKPKTKKSKITMFGF